MAVVIHRVVVIVYEVPAMVRKFGASIPHIIGNVGMVIVHTTINDGYDDTCSRISQTPNLVSIHFGDIPLIGRCSSLKNDIFAFFTISDGYFRVFCHKLHIGSLGDGIHHFFCHRAADGIDNPKGLNVFDQLGFLALLQIIQNFFLTVIGNCFQLIYHKLFFLGLVEILQISCRFLHIKLLI